MLQRKEYVMNMIGSIPHQKFCCYHLPPRGRVGIKLGDVDTSPTYLKFLIDPCYYIICFGCLMGFIIHFYIIFGTILLTEGPVRIAVFFLFQCFEGKEYQTESKRNKTFGNVIFGTNVIQRTWSGRQATGEEAMRQGARLPPWARPPPSWAPRSSPGRPPSPIYTHIPSKHQIRTPKPSEASMKT